MVNKVGDMNGIALYEDQYMEDDKIMKGRKSGYPNTTFFIANPKTAKLIYKTYQSKLRKDKLNYLNNL